MRIPAVLFTVLLVASNSASAQTFAGVGTRATGMGGAFVAVADDASAIYWNPAGLATGATFDLQVSWGLTPVPVRGSDPNLFVGAAMPVLGIAFYRTHTVLASPDRQNEGSGKVQIRTLTTANVGVTVVQTVVPGLVIGTTARLVSGGIEPFDTRTTADFDAGAMVSAGSVRVGLTARNLRQAKFEAGLDASVMERQVRVGAAWVPRSLPTGIHGPYSLAFDADVTASENLAGPVRIAALGGEYWFLQGRFGARAGFQWSTRGDANGAVSGGLTLKLPRSIFVEGQLTKASDASPESTWTVGARVTF
jgi:hypothetical protein